MHTNGWQNSRSLWAILAGVLCGYYVYHTNCTPCFAGAYEKRLANEYIGFTAEGWRGCGMCTTYGHWVELLSFFGGMTALLCTCEVTSKWLNHRSHPHNVLYTTLVIQVLSTVQITTYKWLQLVLILSLIEFWWRPKVWLAIMTSVVFSRDNLEGMCDSCYTSFVFTEWMTTLYLSILFKAHSQHSLVQVAMLD